MESEREEGCWGTAKADSFASLRNDKKRGQVKKEPRPEKEKNGGERKDVLSNGSKADGVYLAC
jgi:hypothetical protein